jgi:2-Cys peroxiredoxin 5
MPSYIENFDKFKAKGIDVYVVSVNDVFVVNAWKKNLIGDAATLNFGECE